MDLSKLDPNLLLTVALLIPTAGRWLWAKLHHQKTVSIEDALWPIVEGYALKLAESEDTVDSIRAKLLTAAREGLVRLGLKPNALVDAVVAKLVERGITETRKRILARQTAAQLDAVLGAASKVTTAVLAPTVPVLGIAVETVGP